MAEIFDAPIPGMAMTHELGARPWQNPPQYATVEEALDYYIPRMANDAFSDQLVDIMQMGVPLTTLANTVQMSGVMDGKHSADIGILILPVLIEMMQFIGDSAGVEYNSGLEDSDEPRSSIGVLAIDKLRKEEAMQEKEEGVKEEMQPELPMDMPEEEPKGLMARRA